MSDTILLDADLFMALGFSAEAHGGVGREMAFDAGQPLCVRGHAWWLDGNDAQTGLFVIAAGPADTALRAAHPHACEEWRGSLIATRNDDRLRKAGVDWTERVPFAKWCEIVGVDVR